MKQDQLVTRVATLDELALLLSWAHDEGWNPGIEDTHLFYSTDPTGFFISLLNDQPIAGISLVKLNSEHAFLGLYLCKQEYRGKGYGIQTWSTALKTVSTRSIGLDGVVEQQENYTREQFSYSHRNVRFAGQLSRADIKSESNAPMIVTANATHVERLSSYDAAIGGLMRQAYFDAWFHNNSSRRTYLAVEGDTIIGVIGARQCSEGFKIGPWLADDSHIAERLLQHMCEQINYAPFLVDVPEPNQAAIDIMQRNNLQAVFETARMYRGNPPIIKTEKLFGVATLELG